ncbi:hypothetical protein FDI11_gp57 [Mycobacterium phage Tiger]|uniref:Uncharacterized protein n=2 Tax=Benedictvirus TaxID=2946819 RepID=H9NCU9_9CAUD|nr:hypothetical protein X823_gp58 [Mycobacterium phage Conspiracy]YP_008859060.1 hypothetical protein X816_gp56 [Mycobacterium phage Jovo]YP_009607678.1 hypothetical protein FDI11_gp57 [Mycobacterium phage Tiger]ATW60009.1 hypothetical protein SEA_PHLORENCE_35 [Mycobacterium phage Phlorence]ATW60427.1 hypothetical protein SEA_FORGETIT_35 [Mycobacterium phage ForGetIt]ATW60981.1 hypothetical protein SEA_ARAGOG_35 [Mycobacterium phage Aragog]ATW61223.1 hypothetical protein SEA_AGENTM_35 [Mycoba
MENDEFFDFIYQEWAKTTGAQDRFYVVVDQGETAPKAERFLVKASAEDGSDVFVAAFEEEADADWFASVHGCFADLIRTLKDQADEIERLDERVDDQEHDIFNLVMSEKKLLEEIDKLTDELAEKDCEIHDLLTEISSLEGELSYAYSEGSEY